VPQKFLGGQHVRWMSEAHGGEQRGRVHVAYPAHWDQLEKGYVPVVTPFALVMVLEDVLHVAPAPSAAPV
jgi:hypothetical protein